jgi:thiamine-monophosphate kinase
VPSRAGARAGDELWVTGTIGDAGAGLRILTGALQGDAALAERYRLPTPRLEAGQRLAPLVSAMMDVSDGLLIDAVRMAEASGAALSIDLARLPLSAPLQSACGSHQTARLAAATAGDDYELLFAAAPSQAPALLALSQELGLPFTRLGGFSPGSGLSLLDGDTPLPLPERLGWEHGASVVESAGRAP